MRVHGNSNKNNKKHHLYAIKDRTDDDTLKYGISSEEIGGDGLSKRIRVQLKNLNLGAGWLRYYGVILLKGILGQKRAKQEEKEHVEKYVEDNGRRPRGND